MTTTPTLWGANAKVNPSSTGFQGMHKVIGLSNGNHLVVFADDSGTVGTGADRDIVGVIYDATGAVVRSAFQVNSVYQSDDEEMPAIAADDNGGFYMAYEDRGFLGQSIRVERFDANGDVVTTSNFSVQEDPGTAFINSPSIAVSSNGNVLVSYQWSDGADDSVRAKLLDSNLNFIEQGPGNTGVILRTDDNPSDFTQGVFNPETAALTNGNFATAFLEYDGIDGGIEVRISSGTTGNNSTNIQVSAANGVLDYDPRVAGLTGGGFVVVWVEDDGTADNIMYAIYDNTGSVVKTPAAVVATGNNYFAPDVVALKDGGFFIVARDGSEDVIEGTRYDAAGNLVGANMFDMVTAGSPNVPELGLTTDGRILLSWTDSNGDIFKETWDPRDAVIIADGTEGVITARATEATSIIGTNADEEFIGQDFADTINGGEGDDTIDGGGENDLIIDYDGANTLSGGAGDDVFELSNFSLSNQTLNGGIGSDTVDYSSVTGSSATFVVGFDIDQGYSGDGAAFSGDWSQLEGLIGIQNYRNDIVGNASANNLTGGKLDDTISGEAGNDTIIGGLGNDSIDGGDDADLIWGDDPFGLLRLNEGSVVDQYAEATTFDAMPTAAFTVEWLFQSFGAQVNDASFVSYATASASNEFLVFGASGGEISVFVNGNQTFTGVDTDTVFDGEVHRMSVSVDTTDGTNGRISLYIDGVEVFSGPGNFAGVGAPIESGGTFIVGQDQDSLGGGFQTTQALQGSVGDIRVWSTDRTQTDIDDTKFTQFTRADLSGNPSLVANWQVDLIDAEISALTGTQALDRVSAGSNPFTVDSRDIGDNGGNDTITGGIGADDIFGGSGNDSIDGGEGDDSIEGGAGDDTLLSGEEPDAADTLRGGSGDDVLEKQSFTDGSAIGTFDGGDDTDLFFFSASGSATPLATQVVDLSAGRILFNGFNRDILIDIENVRVAGDAGIVGDGNANHLSAVGDGANSIQGGGGDDTIDGGDGDDTIEGGAGADDMDGGGGVNTLSYAASGGGVRARLDFGIFANNTNAPSHATGDTVANVSNVIGSAFADRLAGDAGDNSLSGGDGDDQIIDYRGGRDTMLGGGGDDSIEVETRANTVGAIYDGGTNGLTGDLLLVGFLDALTSMDLSDDTVTGFEKLQVREDRSSNTASVSTRFTDAQISQFGDIEYASPSNETPGRIEVTMQGTSLDLSGKTIDDPAGLLGFAITGTGAADSITGSAIDDLILGDGGADSLSGGEGDNTIRGGAGDDTIEGGADDDTIEGGVGADDMDGGGGVNTVTYANAAAGVGVNLSLEYVFFGGDAGDTRGFSDPVDSGDRLVNFQRVIGSSFADSLIATNDAETLTGGDGNDTLQGLGGDDRLEGGADADTLSGDAGVDTLLGGGGDDLFRVISSSATDGQDSIDGGAGTDTLGFFGFGGDTVDIRGYDLTSIEVVRAEPSAGDDLTLQLDAAQFGTGIALNGLISGGTPAGRDRQIEVFLDTPTLDLSGLTFDSWDADDEIVFRGANTAETITGTVVDDLIEGNGGDDSLSGGLGDDTLQGGSGGDAMDGGGGVNTLSYAGSDAGVRIDLGSGFAGNRFAATSHADGDTIANFDNIVGSGFGDLLTGDAGDNSVVGGAGSDRLLSFGGTDTLRGGADADSIEITVASNTVGAIYDGGETGVDDDEFEVNTTDTVTLVDFTDDTVTGFETLALRFDVTGSADTVRFTDAQIAQFTSVTSSAATNGGIVAVAMQGLSLDLSGTTTTAFSGNPFRYEITGGSGGETVAGSSVNDVILGNGGNDSLAGGGGNDTLNGGGGTDTLGGGGGDDRFVYALGWGQSNAFGGIGTDTVDFSAVGAGGGFFDIDLGVGITIGTGALNSTFSSIENATGSQRRDLMTGTSGANFLEGQGGNDTLNGLGGTDTLSGGGGDDTFVYALGWGTSNAFGGIGTDTVDFSAVGAGGGFFDIDLGVGITIGTGALNSTFSSIENATGSQRRDLMTGTAGANLLEGAGGNDTLNGLGGTDTLSGGGGDDLFVYALGWGQSNAFGGIGTDTVDFSAVGAGGGFFDIDLGVGITIGTGALNSTFSSIENATGSQRNDLMTGTAGANFLEGQGGNDTLNGLGGTDTLGGGGGDDTFVYEFGWGQSNAFGGIGTDTVDFSAIGPGGGVFGIDLNTGISIGGALNSTFSSIENATGTQRNDDMLGTNGNNLLRGGGGNDTVNGFFGDDTVSGGGGNDVLIGSAGDDDLYGGLGFDRFVLAFGADVVHDFQDDIDALWLREAIWGGGLSIPDVFSTYGSVSGGDTVLDFGNGSEVFIIEGVTNMTTLYNDVVLF